MEIFVGLLVILYFSFLLFFALRAEKGLQKEREARLEFYRLANESLSVWLVKNREEVS